MTKQNLTSLPKIVIVGGGAGGLELAAGLGNKFGKKHQADIILVDSEPIHLWKPLLHEVAAGTLNSYEDEINYLANANQHHFQFCLGTMHGLNREKKEIILSPIIKNNQNFISERRLSYDYLVIAVGSISNDFNVPGVNEYCYFIDSIKQAKFFQQTLLQKMIQLSYEPIQAKKYNIVIIGGGATGVELIAELHYAIYQMANYGMNFNPKNISLTIIEGSTQLLPALSYPISKMATQELEKLNINIMINQQVTQVKDEGVLTQSGNVIPADLIIWTAGIRAPHFLQNLDGLESNKMNQLLVKPTLQTTRDFNILAMGDCSSYIPIGNNKPIPPRAQAAHQQAKFLIKNFHNLLTNKPLPDYHYYDYGSLISISRYETVGNLMGRLTKSMKVEGLLARSAYLGLYRLHQVALFGIWRVSMLMLANKLTRKIRPRLKLH